MKSHTLATCKFYPITDNIKLVSDETYEYRLVIFIFHHRDYLLLNKTIEELNNSNNCTFCVRNSTGRRIKVTISDAHSWNCWRKYFSVQA